MRRAKTSLIIVCTVVTIGVLGSQFIGSIWPAISIVVGSGSLILLFLVLQSSSHSNFPTILLSSLILSLFYFLSIFLWPASLIGMDPDGYATQIAQITHSGGTSTLSSFFYSTASSFQVIGAIFGIIGDTNPSTAMALYPVSAAMIIVILPYIMSRNFYGERAGMIAALLALVMGNTLQAAYIPISQTLGAMYIFIVVYLLQKSMAATENRQRYFIPLGVFLTSLVFTHKLTSLLAALFVSGTLVSIIIHQKFSKSIDLFSMKRPTTTLAILAISLFVIQSVFLTEFISSIVFSLLTIFGFESPVFLDTFEPKAATSAYNGFEWVFVRRLPAISMIVSGGVAWLAAIYHWHERSPLWAYFSSIGILFALYPISLFATNELRYTRLNILLAPLLVAIIAAVLDKSLNQKDVYSSAHSILIGIFLVAFVAAQVLTPIAAPDHPFGPRMYLTNSEVDAKEFGFTYVSEEIHTDDYYAHEEAYPERRVDDGGNLDPDRTQTYRSLEGDLLMNTSIQCRNNVLYRTNIDIYRYQGIWWLDWEPKPILAQKYSQVYSNGDVIHFAECRGDNQD